MAIILQHHTSLFVFSRLLKTSCCTTRDSSALAYFFGTLLSGLRQSHSFVLIYWATVKNKINSVTFFFVKSRDSFSVLGFRFFLMQNPRLPPLIPRAWFVYVLVEHLIWLFHKTAWHSKAKSTSAINHNEMQESNVSQKFKRTRTHTNLKL